MTENTQGLATVKTYPHEVSNVEVSAKGPEMASIRFGGSDDEISGSLILSEESARDLLHSLRTTLDEIDD